MLPTLTTLQIPSSMEKLKGNPSLDARSWKAEQKLLERNIIILFSGRSGLRGKGGGTALPAGNCSGGEGIVRLLPLLGHNLNPSVSLFLSPLCSGQAVRGMPFPCCLSGQRCSTGAIRALPGCRGAPSPPGCVEPPARRPWLADLGALKEMPVVLLLEHFRPSWGAGTAPRGCSLRKRPWVHPPALPFHTQPSALPEIHPPLAGAVQKTGWPATSTSAEMGIRLLNLKIKIFLCQISLVTSCPVRAALVSSHEEGPCGTASAPASEEQQFLAQAGGVGCWICWWDLARTAAPSLDVH